VSTAEAAEAAFDKACALINERQFRDAVEPAAEACRLRPEWHDAWWNYAVALKHANRWTDCLEACDRAIGLDPANSDGMHWNAGIAATALGDWSRARAAWTAYGVTIPPGDGPLEMELGAAGVRVSLDENPEVIYGKRLDPCRVRVVTVPLPESKHRFGDIVLHDGEARGTRKLGNGEIAVFDELVLLNASEYGTWRVLARCRTPEERDELVALFDDVDGAIEDWTESVHFLCAQCSLGQPHEHHDTKKADGWSIEREFGLALRNERDIARIRQLGLWWRRGVRDVTRVL
jgi:tetratricopeptide (TPR) repeat protein